MVYWMESTVFSFLEWQPMSLSPELTLSKHFIHQTQLRPCKVSCRISLENKLLKNMETLWAGLSRRRKVAWNEMEKCFSKVNTGLIGRHSWPGLSVEHRVSGTVGSSLPCSGLHSAPDQCVNLDTSLNFSVSEFFLSLQCLCHAVRKILKMIHIYGCTAVTYTF